MNDRAEINPKDESKRRDEWTGVYFLLAEMKRLRERGLVSDEAYETIVGEYSERLEALNRDARFEKAIRAARELRSISPREALASANQARELAPERPEGWVVSVEILRGLGRFDESDRIASEAAEKFPFLAGLVAKGRKRAETPGLVPTPTETRPGTPIPRLPVAIPAPEPGVSWSSVAGEFLQEHWQKLISCLAVLLIVVSSTVGANLLLGPLLWSPAGKGVLALVFTGLCAAFGVGLVRWGAERAGQMMLATTLILIPINLMLAGELRLLAAPTGFHLGLLAADGVVLFLMARSVVSALRVPEPGTFTAAYFVLAIFNAGASKGMPFGPGFAVFLAPAAFFLGSVAWLNARIGRKSAAEETPSSLDFAYLEFGLLAFAFLSGVLRTGALLLQLTPGLYAIPAMLAAIAGVSTARTIEPIEKNRERSRLFQQGGLTLSALAFALALARPPGPSALLSGNTLGVALLGLSLYATSLRATRQPAYLHCGFASLFLAYFGAFYFAKDLVHSVEEAARHALGYQEALPAPFKAINGLVFNLALVFLSRFFARSWSDPRLARHCHYIGLPLSIAACLFSAFEPKAAVICLGGYAILYAAGTRLYAEPRLIYLACSAAAGAAFFAGSMAIGPTLGPRSLIASSLGLVFWSFQALPALGRAGASYRTPLVRSARAMAALAMIAATVGWLQDGRISPLSTLAFALTASLALLNGRESPRVSIYLLAIAALLGTWLGVSHLVLGDRAFFRPIHGPVIAGFALALLVAAEALRARLGRSASMIAYLEAIGWGIPVLVLTSWGLAGSRWPLDLTVSAAFLLGSSALIWLTRFRRESVLVYLGLGGLATWASCLLGLAVAWDRSGIAVGWLAITWAACSLSFWGFGELARRRGSAFYSLPGFQMAGLIAAGASVLAIEARSIHVNSFGLGMAAMLAASLSAGLIAASTRWKTAVVLAVASVVAAIDLGLMSQGRALLEVATWIGVASALQAIACRGAGGWIRRASGDSSIARPLDYSAFTLMIVAIPLGYQSPTTLLLIAVTTLLLIGCFPSSGWLYGTFFAIGSAIDHAWLSGFSNQGLIPFVVIGAYLSWGIGVVLERIGPRWLDRWKIERLSLEGPPVRVSVGMGVLAVALRLKVILDSGGPWSGSPWLPWALSVLCLLMLRFDPSRGWVRAAVGLSGFGFLATLATILAAGGKWISAAMALACFWAIAGRGAARVEKSFRHRLGIIEGNDAIVFQNWSIAAFAISATALVAIVANATFPPEPMIGLAGWSDVLIALGFAGLFALLEGRRLDRDGAWIGIEAVSILTLWWLGATGSPLLSRLSIDRLAYLPMVTALGALIVVLLGQFARRIPRSGLADPSDPIEAPRSAGIRLWTSGIGFGLALASAYLSVFSTDRVALPSFIVATLALALLALGWRRVESAYAGGIFWSVSWSIALLLADRSLGWSTRRIEPEVVSLGLVVALFGLWSVAGWVRVRAVSKGNEPIEETRIARAIEWVAIGVALPAIFLTLIGPHRGVWLGSGLFFALAVFFALVSSRLRAEWPVYVAQALLLGCYFRVRTVFVPSELADAVVLSMLGYLDLGLSELLSRFRLSRYARPTFRFSMVLPMVPIAQGIWAGRWDRADLFVLLATGCFYTLTGFRLRSKAPAYAAAVCFNAFLWLGWHQFGWTLSDRPQFYLIPVGFSSILFAEVNRRDLRPEVVRGARNLGLVVIYASLAAPIWQTQSFGAWLALLILSLVGIFVGIGLRVQSFLWLGLACFVADIGYQLGRVGMKHDLARWGVMLTLGVGLMLFVAFNEKKRIVATMRQYYDEARTWE